MTTFPETLGLGQVISRELKEEIERRYNTYVELEQRLAAAIDLIAALDQHNPCNTEQQYKDHRAAVALTGEWK